MLRRKSRGKAKIQREVVVTLVEHEDGLVEDMRELDALMDRDRRDDKVISRPPSRFIFAKRIEERRRIALEMKRGEEAAWATDGIFCYEGP